jgi:hypothetical protein
MMLTPQSYLAWRVMHGLLLQRLVRLNGLQSDVELCWDSQAGVFQVITMKTYVCPILAACGTKEQVGSAWHEETHANMIMHLMNDNGWQQCDIDAWCLTHPDDHADTIKGSRKYPDDDDKIFEVSGSGAGLGMYIARCYETMWEYAPNASMLDRLRGTINFVVPLGAERLEGAKQRYGKWVPALNCFDIEGYAEV